MGAITQVSPQESLPQPDASSRLGDAFVEDHSPQLVLVRIAQLLEHRGGRLRRR